MEGELQPEVSIWRRFIFPFVFVLTLFVLLFIRRPEPRPPNSSKPAPTVADDTHRQLVLKGETMGTSYLVKLIVNQDASGTQWEKLQTRIDQRLDKINDLMSTYRPESYISQLNARSDTEATLLPSEFRDVLSAALDTGEKTQGAFDITLGPLIELWGFDKGERRLRPPTQPQIKERKAYTGLDKISLDDNSFRKLEPRVQINLSGIAKGYAVDAIASMLRQRGVSRYMVEIGGEILVKGTNAAGKPWHLGVNRPTPQADRYEIIETVRLNSGGMATSGSYRNFFNEQGRRYHHIIDPKTGEPVGHQLVSVTVIAPTCMQADALATAAMVMGQDDFEKVLTESYPHTSALFVHQRAESFEVSRTADFPGITQ